MMIVDAHLHVWKPMPDYPNPGSSIVNAYTNVPIELLSEYMDEHGVDRAVLVQPLYPGEDNSYVADCAAADPDRFTAVCVVDPRASDAADRLEYWVTERACKGLRLRPKVPGEDAVFGDPTTYPLWERADALNVVINVLADAEHLPTVGTLAERFPGVSILIDHMAYPDPARGVDAAEFQSLLALAKFPNIYVKPTGYHYYSGERYPFADCHDLFHALYDYFGAARLIWGSDFPHVLLTSGYSRSLHLQERVYTFLSQEELHLIMGGNAASLYWE